MVCSHRTVDVSDLTSCSWTSGFKAEQIEATRIIKRHFSFAKVYLATLYDVSLYEREAYCVSADGLIPRRTQTRFLSLMRVAQNQANS